MGTRTAGRPRRYPTRQDYIQEWEGKVGQTFLSVRFGRIPGQQECLSYKGETMQALLAKMIGKKIDVYCGGASSLRGEVMKVEEGVLHLKDSDEKTCYIAVDKIIVVWEARDEDHRAGFVA